MPRKIKAEKQNNNSACKTTSIGGQAVMEGVMMRGASAMATAVRDADGIIRIESERLTPPDKKKKITKLPIIRGCINFVTSMVGGMKTLMRSAEVYGEAEPSKFEKWASEKLKIDVLSIVMGFSLLLGVALAVGLFILLPIWLRTLIERIIGGGFTFTLVARNFIEGGFKILVFVCYILLVSLLKDIRRTFMYHGAEHKTISCYEKGLELTVENAKKCTRVHDRCGTTFMVFVIVISILVFAGVEAIFAHYGISIEKIWRALLKIALLPLVAGLSYELLKGLAKTKSKIFLPLKAPGLLLQRITTKEPTDDMLEVAITAFNKVLEMDADPTIPEQKFIVPEKRKDLTERIYKTLSENGITEKAEAEWIVSLTAGIKRDEVYTDNLVSAKHVEMIDARVNERITGRPLWYVIGDTDFYGYTIKVDERALIPRPETEELVAQVLRVAKDGMTVLDLCTGSGAIAIAIKKENPNLTVIASDISSDALALAKTNAELNGADIEFIQSDLLENIAERVDIIVSNPPYIKSEDISSLQKEVKDFEPILALDGGETGLDFYKKIAQTYPKVLESGYLFFEVGIDQAQAVKDLFDGKETTIIKDLSNIERIVKVNV